MKKWLVTFIDAGNCDICSTEVECALAHNAPKLAFKELQNTHGFEIQTQCAKVVVELS